MRHVVFDWDGMLADTADDNYAIIKRLHPEVTPYRYFTEHHLGNVFETPRVPFTEETRAAYDRAYAAVLAPHHVAKAIPAVRVLASQFSLHVVTSNAGSVVERVLTEAGVRRHFGLILGAEASPSKVFKLHHLMSEYRARASSVVYVTDTLGDIHEASMAGVRCVAVTFGFHDRNVLRRGKPARIADSWPQVIGHIGQLFK